MKLGGDCSQGPRDKSLFFGANLDAGTEPGMVLRDHLTLLDGLITSFSLLTLILCSLFSYHKYQTIDMFNSFIVIMD